MRRFLGESPEPPQALIGAAVPGVTSMLLVWCLKSLWHLFDTIWFAATFPKSRSFDSAEVRFAQDDRSFIAMNLETGH
jgi:hypothetical protein